MRRFACLLLLVLLAAPVQAKVWQIRYARVSGLEDPHWPYMQSLLLMACEKQRQKCELRPADNMNQGRAMIELRQKQRDVDLFWGMTSKSRETLVMPVRIPLFKGLIGWRVALIQAKNPQLLAKVRTAKDLAVFRAGQVGDWPDTPILESASLPVVVANEYSNLFPMLKNARFDYFPRSVIEVLQEAQMPQAAGLMIDPHIVIHYPAAFYFFVSPHMKDLEAMLEKGLEAGIKDGSFEALFQKYNGEHLRQLKMSQREIIEIDNPLLPNSVPLKRKELWYRP